MLSSKKEATIDIKQVLSDVITRYLLIEMAMTTFVGPMTGEQRRPGALVKHALILSLFFCYASASSASS